MSQGMKQDLTRPMIMSSVGAVVVRFLLNQKATRRLLLQAPSVRWSERTYSKEGPSKYTGKGELLFRRQKPQGEKKRTPMVLAHSSYAEFLRVASDAAPEDASDEDIAQAAASAKAMEVFPDFVLKDVVQVAQFDGGGKETGTSILYVVFGKLGEGEGAFELDSKSENELNRIFCRAYQAAMVYDNPQNDEYPGSRSVTVNVTSATSQRNGTHDRITFQITGDDSYRCHTERVEGLADWTEPVVPSETTEGDSGFDISVDLGDTSTEAAMGGC